MKHGATLLSARSQRVTRSDLALIIPPSATLTWKPIPHSVLIEVLHTELDRRGLRVRKEQYAVQRHGALLFGTLDLDWHDTGEYVAAIGLRTANDKSMSIQLAIGLRVLVCDNLCFSGDLIALRRKHTAGLHLPQELAGALDRYQEGTARLHERINRLKCMPFTTDQAKAAIYDIFRAKMVPSRLFAPVVYTLDATLPTYGATAWWIHNAFTSHIKTLAPAPAFRATLQLGKFFHLQ